LSAENQSVSRFKFKIRHSELSLMIIEKIKYLSNLPPKVIAKKISNLAVQKLKNIQLKKNATHSERRIKTISNISYSYLNIRDLEIQKIQPKTIAYLIKMYSSHRFNLLGSGWVDVGYQVIAPGLEDYRFEMNLELPTFNQTENWLEKVVAPAHLATSKKYWAEVIKTYPDYQPIDWQKDFKSGFRWNAQQWYKEQIGLMGYRPGVDLKVPWELSRLQHLPQMAIFAKVNSIEKNQLVKEFKCQTLDFFATNPVGMGVNYACAMDVGIRAANLCLAYDLFNQLDDSNILDQAFKQIFAQNIFMHGQHILEDLEYKEGLTSNHYLGNITGLLFIAAYLPNTSVTEQWLVFSIQELIVNMDRQFFEDGGNFEASTSYHRLSGEMMVFATALVLGLPEDKRKVLNNYSNKNWKEKSVLLPLEKQLYESTNPLIFSDFFLQKLYKIGYFGLGIRKNSGAIPQFGDNDSGRFFRLSPNGVFLSQQQAIDKYFNLQNYNKQYKDVLFWDEDDLNTDTFLASMAGLFPSSIFKEMEQSFPLEFSLTKGLAKRTNLTPIIPIKLTSTYSTTKLASMDFSTYAYSQKIELGKDKTQNTSTYDKNLEIKIFPDFQIYIFQSARIYLAIGGISNPKQQSTGSHVHNDALSIELAIDGQDLIVDPGTYLYTPIPKHRITFRSTEVHNTLIVENIEQNKFIGGKIGLFSVSQDTKIELVEVTKNSITLRLKYGRIDQIRKVTIGEAEIFIEDYSNVPFKQYFNYFDLYSNGYGKRLN